jgi:hypothetical protein
MVSPSFHELFILTLLFIVLVPFLMFWIYYTSPVYRLSIGYLRGSQSIFNVTRNRSVMSELRTFCPGECHGNYFWITSDYVKKKAPKGVGAVHKR